LVIGGDGLGESFEEKSDGKEGPELASVPLRAASEEASAASKTMRKSRELEYR